MAAQAVSLSPSGLQIVALRAGFGLAVIASLFAAAVRAEAQETNVPSISIRPVAGALIGTSGPHQLLKDVVFAAPLTFGIQ